MMAEGVVFVLNWWVVLATVGGVSLIAVLFARRKR